MGIAQDWSRTRAREADNDGKLAREARVFDRDDYAPADPVFYAHGKHSGGVAGWYFFDKRWVNTHGPYATEWQARGERRRACA